MHWIGTSGYNYPEWKGHFYPDNLPASKMLAFYATRLATVEINYSFYRLPNARTLAGWAERVPEQFRFTLKAPRRITHDQRLRDCASLVRAFCDVAATLGPQLGILLFQLPPNLKRDLDLLDAFLDTLPPGVRATFEFRHESWLDEEVYARLRGRNLALCIADSEQRHTPLVLTSDYGYLRLRDEGYSSADLTRWADVVQRSTDTWRETFVYFKHEEAGKGPEFASELMRILGPAP
ncbi:MAG: DUF72 domain-containing protein [Luteitalea sp.]|nr:DUF72 domain-containing protein [Luteitalea sp.]